LLTNVLIYKHKYFCLKKARSTYTIL